MKIDWNKALEWMVGALSTRRDYMVTALVEAKKGKIYYQGYIHVMRLVFDRRPSKHLMEKIREYVKDECEGSEVMILNMQEISND